jgi:hypothetical protein
VISTTCRMRKQVRTISGTKALQLVALKYLLLRALKYLLSRATAATHRLSVWVVKHFKYFGTKVLTSVSGTKVLTFEGYRNMYRSHASVKCVGSHVACSIVALKYLLSRATAATHRWSVWVVMSLQLVALKYLLLRATAATHRLSVWVVMSLAVMWMVLLICAAETLKSCGGVHEHGHGGHDDHGELEHADQHGSVHEQVHADADKHE